MFSLLSSVLKSNCNAQQLRQPSSSLMVFSLLFVPSSLILSFRHYFLLLLKVFVYIIPFIWPSFCNHYSLFSCFLLSNHFDILHQNRGSWQFNLQFSRLSLTEILISHGVLTSTLLSKVYKAANLFEILTSHWLWTSASINFLHQICMWQML